MLSQPKVPVVVRDAYTICLERYDDHTWGHVDFNVWSASALRDFVADVRLLAELQRAPLFVLHYPDDVRHAKFLRLSGATLYFTTTDAAGNALEVHKYH